MNGIFITFEGADGSGKTTQIELLNKYLKKKGYDIVVTREPGGTAISEAVRNILLDKKYSEMSYNTEMLLYAAARAQLVEQVIIPSLDAGRAVIADRFVDSSAVYQGIARGLGIDTVYEVNSYALCGVMPQLTILLDLPAEAGILRKKNQAELDRLESETLVFHRRVAEGYRTLAERYPERIMKIDAALPIEEIHAIITDSVEKVIRKETGK